jgi:hypothetical protein
MTPLHLAAAWTTVLAQTPAPSGGAGGVGDIKPTKPDFDTSKFTALAGYVQWGGLIICAVGIVGIGTMMAVSIRRGEGGEHVSRLGMALLGVVIVSLGPAIVASLAK